MAFQETPIRVDHDGGNYEGLLVTDTADPAPRHGVLVCHAWAGRSELEDRRARELAEAGFAALSIDLFGIGIRGDTKEECSALIEPFVNDRERLRQHLTRWLETLAEQDGVDAERLSVIGFCFGGLCALDLARSEADLHAAISFHGLLGAPGGDKEPDYRIKARVLALHGWDDPMGTPEQVVAFGREMSAAGADWQLHAYGNTQHAFTNPNANDHDFGTVYDAKTERRSMQAMLNLLREA
ncbi:MAG: carboxymethylenebutenolidase [Gammaproteobacteria bacterium]|nr:MAG: carboxymethylenebutenolidase [Gammaproteobacteria bacterium]